MNNFDIFFRGFLDGAKIAIILVALFSIIFLIKYRRNFKRKSLTAWRGFAPQGIDARIIREYFGEQRQ